MDTNTDGRNLLMTADSLNAYDFIQLDMNKGSLQKKKPKKSLEFSKPGGRGSMPIPNFFFDFFGFSLKPLGKHWKWSDSSRNAKKKNSFLYRGGTLYCTALYSTGLFKIIQYTNKI